MNSFSCQCSLLTCLNSDHLLTCLRFWWRSRSADPPQILAALGTENNRPSSAAQCVAYIAIVELPQNQWTELVSVLVNNVIGPGSTEIIKEASLEAIGYICQVRPTGGWRWGGEGAINLSLLVVCWDVTICRPCSAASSFRCARNNDAADSDGVQGTE